MKDDENMKIHDVVYIARISQRPTVSERHS
jgi:hypothetical protein